MFPSYRSRSVDLKRNRLLIASVICKMIIYLPLALSENPWFSIYNLELKQLFRTNPVGT